LSRSKSEHLARDCSICRWVVVQVVQARLSAAPLGGEDLPIDLLDGWIVETRPPVVPFGVAAVPTRIG